MKTFYIHTFGCKLNQSDSAAIRAELSKRGMKESLEPADADVVIVNTCTVTSRADRHARQAIRRLKRSAPAGKLVVTGCYVERTANGLAQMPEIEAVFGLSERPILYEFVTGIEADDDAVWPFDPETDFGNRTRAFLKVQEGCNLQCAYCIVRIVRGPSRSLPSAVVRQRLKALRKRGYREVVLTGIHLGLWGRDIGEGSLVDLLKMIDNDPDTPNIRLCSLEPFEVGDDLLERMVGSRKIAPHLHLAVQSGSPKILKSMRRPPHPEEIARTARRARELMPECGIGADVIVGFPGETDDDVALTVRLLTKAPFTYAHVFAFSPRPGTEAADMPNRVHTETIKRRSADLRAKMREKNFQFRQSLVGKTVDAVILKQTDDRGRAAALTGNYIHVSLEKDVKVLIGDPCKLLITKADFESTTGRIVPRK